MKIEGHNMKFTFYYKGHSIGNGTMPILPNVGDIVSIHFNKFKVEEKIFYVDENIVWVAIMLADL